jgi:hypothetical protein
VLNAFLNAPLEQLVYVRTPELFVAQIGELLELKRALYGLKDAPLLWYRHLKDTLIRLGLRPVQDVPCLFTSDQLILFFYVDDIIVLVHPRYLSHHSLLSSGPTIRTILPFLAMSTFTAEVSFSCAFDML